MTLLIAVNALYVPVEPLRHVLPPSYIGFLDLQAVLNMDFFTARRAVILLRDAGLLHRFPRGLNKPDYMVTHIGERALALGAGRAKVPITGEMVDTVTNIVRDVNLALASLGVRHGGCAAMTITLSVRAGRDEELEDRVRRLVERLERPAAKPLLRLALAQEARAARGGEG